MSSIHICAITFDLFPFEPRAFRLVQAASDAGCSVDVICLRQADQKRYEEDHGIHIYRMPMTRSYNRSLPAKILCWCWFLLLAGVVVTWLHLKRPYDVVQVHNMPDFLVFSALIPKILGAKIVLDVQDASPELMAENAKGFLGKAVRTLVTWQERISTAFADHIITIGWTLEELLQQRGVPKKKLTSILNSADPKIFPSSGQSSSYSHIIKQSAENRPFTLMYHGTVEERAGLDTALRALALVRHVVPEIRFQIKGFGEAPILKQLATELKIDDLVVFSERCPVKEVADFIVNGDVGIMPYRSGGYMELVLPTKAFEFALMQRAMIASNLQGIRSMFRPESIALCEPSNPEDFARAIIDLYQHPNKRMQLVANALEDYSSYKWELMAAHYQQILASLCNKNIREEYR